MKTNLASTLLILIVVAAIQVLCDQGCWNLSPPENSDGRILAANTGVPIQGAFILYGLEKQWFPDGQELKKHLKTKCGIRTLPFTTGR